jgi:hypothetical protein
LASKWAAVRPANPEPMTATFTAELGWVIWKERKEQRKVQKAKFYYWFGWLGMNWACGVCETKRMSASSFCH